MAGLQADTAIVAGIAEAEKDHYDLKKGDDVSSTDEKSPFDGVEYPTEEEIATLRRVSDTIPWTAYLIAIVEMAERFSFYGCSVVFTNFMQQPLPEGSSTGSAGPDVVPGALGLGQNTAFGLSTFYQFWCYVTPLFGAYLADTRLGRFKAVCVGVAVALVGHVVLIVAAIPGVIDKKAAIAPFILGMIIMGAGTGLFKANISPLIAEQYQQTKLYISTTPQGERVIVDPSYTISRVYMYFYMFINIGALVGQLTMAYTELYVGFYLAFTLPTVVFLICPLVLWAGNKRYIKAAPQGSVLITALRILRKAAADKWSPNPIVTYRNFRRDDFWEAAKPSNQVGELPKWMTFDDQWVDEVGRGFKACAVFTWFPLYWLTYNQLNNNLTSQAAVMTRHGVPNDVLSNLNPISLIIFIPLADKIIYPALARWGIRFTALKKITLGFFFGAAAMVWAAVTQHYIYQTNPCGKFVATCDEVSSLNVWIQSGSYVLVGISEICASITGLEYAFTKAPKNMRSLVMSVFLFTSALASALGQAFVPLSGDPLLVWNYTIVAIVAVIAGLLCWIAVFKLDQREDELNNLPAGHLHAHE
ncbi:peptide transporter PTR2A [Mucidula mucida]|nr:peptide transporter PTR2A [Mucidula mucida]